MCCTSDGWHEYGINIFGRSCVISLIFICCIRDNFGKRGNFWHLDLGGEKKIATIMECQGHKRNKFDPRRELALLEEGEKRRRCELGERKRVGATKGREGGLTNINKERRHSFRPFGIFTTKHYICLSSSAKSTQCCLAQGDFWAKISTLSSMDHEFHP